MPNAARSIPWPILLLAMLLPTVGALIYFTATNPESSWFRILYGSSKALQFALPVLAVMLWDRQRIWQIRLSSRGLGVGILFGVGTFVLMWLTYAILFRRSESFAGLADQVRSKVAGFGLDSIAGFIGMAIVLSIIHSIAEEYYWRWFVFDRLKARLPLFTAAAVSSLAFTSHHVIVLHTYFPDHFWSATVPFSTAIAMGGGCWAWWYHRTGSLAGPWAAHIGADLGIMAVGYNLLFVP